MIFHATYLGSREVPNISICITQFFRNFPPLDVFIMLSASITDFLTFILISLTVMFFSFHVLPFVLESLSFFFSVSLLCLSTSLSAFKLMFDSVFDFSLVCSFCYHHMLRIPQVLNLLDLCLQVVHQH